MTKDPAWALAEHIVGTSFAKLPAATRTATCNDILDTFGCLLGGSGAPGIAELVRVTAAGAVRRQSQVMLWQRRLPAPQAAMLNASMAHALDFDDTLDHGGSIHPGASVLAASLAVSDMLGGVSGERLLLAVCARARCVLPRCARVDIRSRLASHGGDGRVRRRRGRGQAARL